MHRHFLLLTYFLMAIFAKGQTMADEADRFLSAMPENLQKKQEAAVREGIAAQLDALVAVRNSRNVCAPLPAGVSATDIGGKYRLYMPDSLGHDPVPVLIYMHGGGWCFGSVNSCSKFCGELCRRASIAVLAVEYPLAPEHPYPAALNACVDAVQYVFDNAGVYNFDTGAVSAGGDSSGGNLALATALRLSYARALVQNKPDEAAIPRLESLLLFYPVVKAWNDNSRSWQLYDSGYGLDGGIMEAFNEAYLTDNDAELPFISPFCAPADILATLPRTLIVNAERDILADQGAAMYQKLNSAGVDVSHSVYPGAVHLFITVEGQPAAFESAVAASAAFLQPTAEVAEP